MSNQNANEIVVASSGTVSVAPYGTALPTDPTAALNAAFIDLGYISSAGVTFTATPSITDITAWQSASPVRRIVQSRALTVNWVSEQINLETWALAFGQGGGAWSQVTAGKYRYDPPQDTDALVDLSLVIDAADGSKHYRYVVNRGNVNSAVASTLVRTAAQDLPITFDALTPSGATRAWYFLTDDVNLSYAS